MTAYAIVSAGPTVEAGSFMRAKPGVERDGSVRPHNPKTQVVVPSDISFAMVGKIFVQRNRDWRKSRRLFGKNDVGFRDVDGFFETVKRGGRGVAEGIPP